MYGELPEIPTSTGETINGFPVQFRLSETASGIAIPRQIAVASGVSQQKGSASETYTPVQSMYLGAHPVSAVMARVMTSGVMPKFSIAQKVPARMFDLFGSGGAGQFSVFSLLAILLVSTVQNGGLSHNMGICGSAKNEFAARSGVSGTYLKRFMIILWAFAGLIA